MKWPSFIFAAKIRKNRSRKRPCAAVRTFPKGTTTGVVFEIPLERLRSWNTAANRYVVEPGAYEFLVGSASDDIRARLPLTITASK